ncbi:MAG: hypothetical protein KJO38_00990, partial [Gammaproteobacteria bacterium]|nr:hypothetical protein [Gammaproteobacteria bacterium]
GRNDARRIDRQLFGRAGRQGDPGSVEALVVLGDSFEDSRWAAPIRRLAGRFSDPLPRGLGSALVRFAQWRIERRHARARNDLLRHDGQLAKALAFTGRLE